MWILSGRKFFICIINTLNPTHIKIKPEPKCGLKFTFYIETSHRNIVQSYIVQSQGLTLPVKVHFMKSPVGYHPMQAKTPDVPSKGDSIQLDKRIVMTSRSKPMDDASRGTLELLQKAYLKIRVNHYLRLNCFKYRKVSSFVLVKRKIL